MWAVFKDRKQVSKSHSTKHAALTEAMEMGAAVTGSSDFPDHEPIVRTVSLVQGVEIKEIGDV